MLNFERLDSDSDFNYPVRYKCGDEIFYQYFSKETKSMFLVKITSGDSVSWKEILCNIQKVYKFKIISKDESKVGFFTPKTISLNKGKSTSFTENEVVVDDYQLLEGNNMEKCLPGVLYKAYFLDGNPTKKRFCDTEVANKVSKPILQIIKFGSPGTGKSFSIRSTIKEHDCRSELPGKKDPKIIRTVFHPDYSYGDFTSKLVPISVGEAGAKKVEYQIHTGPFVKSLAKALVNPGENIYLIIEEINRGNTAAIFGDIFQLLDRDDCGESEYPITPAHLFIEGLQQELCKLNSNIKSPDTIVIPSNLSLIATMNTSDESVFYMDSAFKRRWHFEYIDVDADIMGYEGQGDKNNHPLHFQIAAKIEDYDCNWNQLRADINTFIKGNKNSIRRIEDKLIGLWFIKAKNGKISKDEITNKLMHYLWDNVFARDKSPLIDKLDEGELHTFGDFVKQVDVFLEKFSCPQKQNAKADAKEET